ncbi:MAG: hypothetical protein ACNYWU_13320, partial [Desulfobacterales bacterium]
MDNADSNNNPGAQNAQGLGRLPAALSSTGAENGWPLELHVHAGDTGQDTVKGTYGMYMGRGGHAAQNVYLQTVLLDMKTVVVWA